MSGAADHLIAASLGEYRISDSLSRTELNAAIPDASLEGVSDVQRFDSDWIIEGVQINLTAEHKRLADLAVELISPSGTRSVLMTPYNGFVPIRNSGYTNTPMLSNAFYGENARGNWTLKVIDVNSGEQGYIYREGTVNLEEKLLENEANGVLKSWSLRIHGHQAVSAS
ncbi:hypothetical protein GII14_14780 [Shewanella chilikensis]|uniref:P/Homo B domain-containing protein n=1 Tax=Shewanella chilikensis TaxID=558541 RepID=A0A6G7LU13_9GAMM|nr:hypothetical protein GII14_14780 [Shewanella chilikensis]